MPFLRKQGPDVAQHLGFHLAPYTNNKTIAVGCSLLSKAGYVCERVDGVSGSTLVKILFPWLSITVKLGNKGSLVKQPWATLKPTLSCSAVPASAMFPCLQYLQVKPYTKEFYLFVLCTEWGVLGKQRMGSGAVPYCAVDGESRQQYFVVLIPVKNGIFQSKAIDPGVALHRKIQPNPEDCHRRIQITVAGYP